MRQPKIIQTSYIRDYSIYLEDQKLIGSDIESDIHKFCKDIYVQSGIKYPKFHKMDVLSKMAILCAEPLLSNQVGNTKIASDRIGIFIANKSSSLHTDRKYVDQSFTEEGLVPNPALFVYTLPNIMLGELSIRHGLTGEQCMWISDSLESEFISKYVLSLFDEDVISSCLIGWVDMQQNEPMSFMSWVSNEPNLSQYLQDFSKEALQEKYELIKLK